MRYRITLLILVLVSVAGLSPVLGCKPAPAAIPAQFDVSSLSITPKQVYVGDTISASAQITNSGGTAGIYNVVMVVNGARTTSKAVTVDAGATETVTFSLPGDTAGTYKVAVGDRSSSYTVNPKLAAKPTELKYDDGNANDYLSVDKPCTGYLVSFIPSSIPFIINRVRIYGLIYGGHGFMIRDISLQIWDKDKKVIYNTPVDKDKFPLLAYLPADIEKQGAWVDVDIADFKVNGNFYVHVYTGTSTGQGFRMGADDSPTNVHSDVTIRDSGGADSISPAWPYPFARWFGDKSRVNWMVRVIGTAMVSSE